MQVFRWFVVYLLFLELALAAIMPGRITLGQRMDYSVVEKNQKAIDIYLESIQHQIKQEHLDDYIIILGDSVAYSGPGPSSQSIGAHLQALYLAQQGAHAPQVFNLSFPAMQVGDIYTMLLKFDQYGISTDNVIINVLYAGFLPRHPGPPAVFWLKQDLRQLAPEAYQRVDDHLQANGYQVPRPFYGTLHDVIWQKVALFKYKDFLHREAKSQWVAWNQAEESNDAIGDDRPWYDKPELPELLQQEQYQRDFSDQKIDMSPANPQIFFLNKIIEHQQGKKTLIFLAGTNQELMKDRVSSPGYQTNLNRIDNFLSDQPVTYLNLQGVIPDQLFTDHVHLTGEGYRELARILGEKWMRS